MLSYALTLWLLAPAPLLAPATPRVVAPSKMQKRPTPRRVSTMRLGPMLFTVQGGKIKKIEQLKLKELYRAASTMYQAKKYPIAIKLYRRLLKFFPKSKFRYAALYNLALVYEDNKQFAPAIKAFQQVILENPKRTKLVLNTKFRTAACYNQLKQWKSAFATYDELLQGNLSPNDRIDALAYAGRALFHLKHHSQALPLLKLAVNIHLQNKKKELNYGAAMAQYYHAQIHDQKFRTRKFHLPQSRLKKDLDFKSKNLLKAQKLYFQTIRLRHADWALAALYRIGDMYETMYQNMMAAPIPKDLKKEEVKIYQELLRKKIKILLAKALLAYRMNLKLSAFIGLKSHRWKTRSIQRFQTLLQFYKKRFGGIPKLLQKKSSKVKMGKKSKLKTNKLRPASSRPATPRSAPKVTPKQAPRATIPKPPKKPTTKMPKPKAKSRK